MTKNFREPNKSFQLLERFSVVLSLVASDLIDLPQPVRLSLNLISYGLLFILVGINFKRVIHTFTTDVSLILIVLLAVFSFVWSADPENTSALIRGLLRSTILGAYIATRYTLKQQISIYAWMFGCEAILSLLACIFFPAYGISFTNDQTTWKGIFGHKQYLARTMALGVAVFLFKAINERSSRRITIPLLVLCVSLIVFSTSRTGLILVFSTLGVFLISKIARQYYKVRTSLLIVLLVVVSLASFILTNNFEFIVVDLLGKDLELNGRVPLWKLAIEKGLERPLFGYGYEGFWNSDAGNYVAYNTWGKEILFDATRAGSRLAWHAHNGFVELFVQLGFVGLSLMGLNLFCGIRRVMKLMFQLPEPENFWMLQVVITAFILNSVEVMTLLASNSIFWVFYVSVMLTASLKLNWLQKRNLKIFKLSQISTVSPEA